MTNTNKATAAAHSYGWGEHAIITKGELTGQIVEVLAGDADGALVCFTRDGSWRSGIVKADALSPCGHAGR